MAKNKNEKKIEKLERGSNLGFSKIIIFIVFLGVFSYLIVSVLKNLSLPLEIVKPQNFLLGVDIITNGLFMDNLEKAKSEIVIVFLSLIVLISALSFKFEKNKKYLEKILVLFVLFFFSFYVFLFASSILESNLSVNEKSFDAYEKIYIESSENGNIQASFISKDNLFVEYFSDEQIRKNPNNLDYIIVFYKEPLSIFETPNFYGKDFAKNKTHIIFDLGNSIKSVSDIKKIERNFNLGFVVKNNYPKIVVEFLQKFTILFFYILGLFYFIFIVFKMVYCDKKNDS